MRRYIALALSLLAAGCATAPQQQQQPQVQEISASVHSRGELVGLTADDLVRRFGTPALQIREGASVKMQFRSAQCVLDAYLYPSGNAPYRVTYVDTRTPALADIDQALCVRTLEAP